MKKILLAVLLLALVVVVSYLKTWREHERSRQYFDQGKTESLQQLTRYQKESDSLQAALAETRLAAADSLTSKDKAYRSSMDSLQDIIDEQSAELSKLSSNQGGRAGVKTSSSGKPLSKHEQIISYYKKRYANLPRDLSDYERRIALNEIREETSQKFSISLEELKEIRNKFQLRY
ncbi:MAG: hypothetical protein JSW34_11425 [Candidatus Zixiibacteriota bacterium]|nr:MAG: hypothetical protein JSW34_11425 [candidate division Zixibacteria bacterium]